MLHNFSVFVSWMFILLYDIAYNFSITLPAVTIPTRGSSAGLLKSEARPNSLLLHAT